jgi:hypothetical protein
MDRQFDTQTDGEKNWQMDRKTQTQMDRLTDIWADGLMNKWDIETKRINLWRDRQRYSCLTNRKTEKFTKNYDGYAAWQAGRRTGRLTGLHSGTPASLTSIGQVIKDATAMLIKTSLITTLLKTSINVPVKSKVIHNLTKLWVMSFNVMSPI